MTTAENFRRRQRFALTLIILMGFLMIYQGIQQNNARERVEKCFAGKIDALTKSYTARASINERDSKIKSDVILNIARAKDQKTVRMSLDQFVTDQTAVDKDRKDNAPPPFPPGRCEDKNQ